LRDVEPALPALGKFIEDSDIKINVTIDIPTLGQYLGSND